MVVILAKNLLKITSIFSAEIWKSALFLGWKITFFFIAYHIQVFVVKSGEKCGLQSWNYCMLILTRFPKPAEFCRVSWEDIYWKSARFLGQISFENQLIIWGKYLLKISSLSGAEIYWKSARCLGQISFENQLVFLSRSTLKIKIVFWGRNLMKISSFSVANIL